MENVTLNDRQTDRRTLRSRSSEKVSTMMPKMMLRPMVVMKMKNETWKMTRNPNLKKEFSAG